MTEYKVVRPRLEIERGAKFTLEQRQSLIVGSLYLFQIGKLLILGRWFPGWIVQPGRWIDVGRIAVETIGQIMK